MTESENPEPASAASDRLPSLNRAPWQSFLIWAGLALALIGRFLSFGAPNRRTDFWVVAFFVLPFGVLTWWAYTRGRGRTWFRAVPAALFAFLAIEAFYFGITVGGLAAAFGAIMVYIRFVRPR